MICPISICSTRTCHNGVLCCLMVFFCRTEYSNYIYLTVPLFLCTCGQCVHVHAKIMCSISSLLHCTVAEYELAERLYLMLPLCWTSGLSLHVKRIHKSQRNLWYSFCMLIWCECTSYKALNTCVLSRYVRFWNVGF